MVDDQRLHAAAREPSVNAEADVKRDTSWLVAGHEAAGGSHTSATRMVRLRSTCLCHTRDSVYQGTSDRASTGRRLVRLPPTGGSAESESLPGSCCLLGIRTGYEGRQRFLEATATS